MVCFQERWACLLHPHPHLPPLHSAVVVRSGVLVACHDVYAHAVPVLLTKHSNQQQWDGTSNMQRPWQYAETLAICKSGGPSNIQNADQQISAFFLNLKNWFDSYKKLLNSHRIRFFFNTALLCLALAIKRRIRRIICCGPGNKEDI